MPTHRVHNHVIEKIDNENLLIRAQFKVRMKLNEPLPTNMVYIDVHVMHLVSNAGSMIPVRNRITHY